MTRRQRQGRPFIVMLILGMSMKGLAASLGAQAHLADPVFASQAHLLQRISELQQAHGQGGEFF